MNHQQPAFYLYHTLGCHLCEEAETVLQPIAGHLQQSILKVDIADHDNLVETYGIRIPVLYHLASGKDLGWPFDAAMALAFMELQCQPG